MKEEEKEIQPNNAGKINKRDIVDELQESYLDYAMSVIVSRALPDVRDGLKPVQRRIFWAMWDSGLKHNAKYKKSANVVGEVLGRYHPHGDAPVYEAMARMAQDFSLRYPLVDGQGNWGSIDGDPPAAMRYCITGDTLLVTSKGLVPMQEASQDNSEVIHESVLSHNRITNSASRWFDSGEHPTISVTTRRGFSIKGTQNHPVLTWTKGPFAQQPTYTWKLLQDVREGDMMVIDRTDDLLWPEKYVSLEPFYPKDLSPRTHVKELPQELTEDLASILGALLAEGSIHEHEIEFCNSDPEWITKFQERWQRVFPDTRLHHFHLAPRSYGRKNYQTLEIHSRHVVAFLRRIGLEPVRAAYKRIPFVILRSPKPVVAAFLRAYFEGDGGVSYSSKMTELCSVSTSEILTKEMQTVFLRFGIATTRRFDRHRNTHKLYIRGLRDMTLFRDSVDFDCERKKAKLRESILRLHKDASVTDSVPYLREYTHSILKHLYGDESYFVKHNFDRYASLHHERERLVTAVRPASQKDFASLTELLLCNHYFFDPVTKIEGGGIQRVYSIRVDSACHSFVANGFVNHNTEARLAKITEHLLTDIEKETVEWQPNYDASRNEPKYVPAKLPNLLLNGTVGIAVGMATSIPPHNLGEIIDATLHLIENPEATVKELMKFVPAPDFPTGGVIYDRRAIETAYATGRGSVTTRAAAEIEEKKNGSFQIVITEIPYQVNKSTLLEKIAELVNEKKIEHIRDVRDESDRDGLRIVVELKQDAAPQKILNQLYEYTELQKNFAFNMVALVGGIQPRILSLKDILHEHIEHRRIIVRRRTEFDLKKAEERAHVLEGLVKALDSIDKVIATIKKSKDRDDARNNLIKGFGLSEIQANAILEMRLQSLAALERQKLEDELKEKKKIIAELKFILAHPKRILEIIGEELKELKTLFPEGRRTKIIASGLTEFREEDLVPLEEVIITFTRDGYIKRMPPNVFKTQKRGGKGLIGSELKEEDMVSQFITASTHDNILFFTDKGRAFQTKVYEIPVAARTAKGKSIHNFLEIPTEEQVSTMIAYPASTEKNKEKTPAQGYLVMATSQGVIKKTPVSDFANVRRSGIVALKLRNNDMLRWVKLSSGKDELIVVTQQGQSIRFKEQDVRAMGRTAAGVKALSLRKGDLVTGLDIIIKDTESTNKGLRLLTVMANGFGKQTPLKEYKVQRRGGSGIKTAQVTTKTGLVIASYIVDDEVEGLIAFSSKGQAIRTTLKDIRIAGRATQGVRIMNIEKGDSLVGIVCL